MTTEGPRLSDTDCAYLAGMIDQSGWIRVRRSGRGSKASRPLVLYIGKLNSEQAKWIRDRLGDRVTLEMGTPRWRADFVTPNDSAVVLRHQPADEVLIIRGANGAERRREPLSAEGAGAAAFA